MTFNRKQFSLHFNIHPETVSKLLRQVGIKDRYLISPKQAELLFDTVFNPLFFRVTRTKLAEWYCMHPETMSIKLKDQFKLSNKKLSVEDITMVYLSWGFPDYLRLKYPNEVKKFIEKHNLPGHYLSRKILG